MQVPFKRRKIVLIDELCGMGLLVDTKLGHQGYSTSGLSTENRKLSRKSSGEWAASQSAALTILGKPHLVVESSCSARHHIEAEGLESQVHGVSWRQ